MSLFSFYYRRNSGLTGPTLVAPSVTNPPVVVSALIGSVLAYVGATGTGVLSPTIALTQILDSSDNVVASAAGPSVSWTVVAGTYRVRQRLENASGFVVTTSSAVTASVDDAQVALSMPTPLDTSTYAITSHLQPGSQLLYLKPSTGELPVQQYETDLIYWWNGSAIVDKNGSTTNAQGVAYGTDPYQPSSAVRRWKHLAACLPTQYGRLPGKRVGDINGGNGNATPRTRKPDFVFIDRGEVLNQETNLADFLAFATSATATGGSFSVTLRGADTGVCCLAACGDPQLPMPKVQDPAGWSFVLYNGGNPSNTRYHGIHFDGSVRGPGYLTGSAGQLAVGTNNTTGDNFVFRDCLFDQCAQIGLPGVASTLRASMIRCVVVGSHNLRTGAINSAIDSHGEESSKLTVIDTWVIDGGYRFNPLKIRDPGLPVYSASATYVVGDMVRTADGRRVYVAGSAGAPAGSPFPADFGSTSYWLHAGLDGVPVGTVFDRNGYHASPTRKLRIGEIRGGSAGQIRHVGEIDRSFFYMGGMAIAKARHSTTGVSGDPDDSSLPQGYIVDSVLLRFAQGSAHPGWGFKIGVGMQNSLVARNVISNAQFAVNDAAVSIDANGWEGSGYLYGYPTRYCRIEDNIGDCGTASFLTAQDGYSGSTNPGYVAPGLMGNTASRNTAISSAVSQLRYVMANGAPATTDTVVDGTNEVFATLSAATAAKGWTGANRTIKTYLTSLGVTVPAEDLDGVNTLIDIVRGQHVYTGNRALGGGFFPAELQPIALRNYIATGRGMPALS